MNDIILTLGLPERISYDQSNYHNGIYRKLINNKFYYFYINNDEPVNQRDLDRILKLKIPPAWTNVWINRDHHASIQAIGVDSKGRKQYRYHQVHIDTAEKNKFLKMIKFIKLLPKLSYHLDQHKKLDIYDKNHVIAFMIHLVKEHHMRVGKEVYAKKNKSYGISSLRKKHVKFAPKKIILRFKGKSNQKLHYTINNASDVNYIKMLMKLKGEKSDKLFQYIIIDEFNDQIHTIHGVTDSDINQYIHNHMGDEFSIKDFRTHAANVHFIRTLLSETRKRLPSNPKLIKKNLLRAFKSAAHHLKHTKHVSKKSYVMNFATEMYQNDPTFFIKLKDSDPNDVVLQLLELYRKKILE
jgi:DNA topoisomerase-1